MLKGSPGIGFMRDATRGGLAGVLCELAGKTGLGIEINEENIPVREEVNGMCELLGFDPLHVANEGKIILVAAERYGKKILEIMKKDKQGKTSAIIGKITEGHKGKVLLNTTSGGKRWIDIPTGEQLPRIC
jgi:hydrogenase expression/formation protein HypE